MREILAEGGVRSLVLKVLGETVYRRLRLFERPLDPVPPLREPGIELEYGFLSEAEVGKLDSLGWDLSSSGAVARLRRGERCFLALHDGRVVSARWLTSGKAFVEYLATEVRLGEGEVYLYDAYTSPAFRNLGVYGAASTRLARLLAAEGRVRTVAAVPPDDPAAVRACESAGYRRAGTVGYFGLGRWRRSFVRRRGETSLRL
jgi:hypothetical protein